MTCPRELERVIADEILWWISAEPSSSDATDEELADRWFDVIADEGFDNEHPLYGVPVDMIAERFSAAVAIVAIERGRSS